uniref:Uncharacterized protein n=1 Tax=Pakpunavirus sp. TaxID=2833053 RepID=A0AB39BZ52_9CAUD
MRPTQSPACLRSATRHTQHTARPDNRYRPVDVRGIGIFQSGRLPLPHRSELTA